MNPEGTRNRLQYIKIQENKKITRTTTATKSAASINNRNGNRGRLNMRLLYVRTYVCIIICSACLGQLVNAHRCSMSGVVRAWVSDRGESTTNKSNQLNWQDFIFDIEFSVGVCTVRMFVCCRSCFCSIVRCISLREHWLDVLLTDCKQAGTISQSGSADIWCIFWSIHLWGLRTLLQCANKSRIKRLKQLWNNFVRSRVRLFSLNHHSYVLILALVMCNYWTIVNKFLKYMRCCCWWIHLVILKCSRVSHVWVGGWRFR